VGISASRTRTAPDVGNLLVAQVGDVDPRWEPILIRLHTRHDLAAAESALAVRGAPAPPSLLDLAQVASIKTKNGEGGTGPPHASSLPGSNSSTTEILADSVCAPRDGRRTTYCDGALRGVVQVSSSAVTCWAGVLGTTKPSGSTQRS